MRAYLEWPRVPSDDPSGESLIMSPLDFQRIKSASRFLTKEEREAARQALSEQKALLVEDMTKRKNFMKHKELQRRKNEKLSALEEEAQQRAQYLLQRANNLRMEQEEEVKKINELVLNAKCHAIRDAQVLEKELIEKEMEAEEKRLDQMMEMDRQKAIQRQEEIDERRKQEMIRGKLHVIEQISENSENRILQEEQREQEAQELLRYLEEMQMEDFRDMERRREEQLLIQAEIKRVNAENERQKLEKKEQDKLADLHVLEYQKWKLAREAEFEAEQKRIKKEKELEVARLRSLQEKAQDYQAEQDALRAKRIQEAMERHWRKKEKEAAEKKSRMNTALNQARRQQVAQKEHMMAVEAQRDRAQFYQILKVQQEKIEKEKKELEEKTALVMRHADELRQQVRENEQRQLLAQIALFEEGKRLQEEARQRRARLDELKKKKLEELRGAGLPDKYCSMVERKANVTQTMVH
ncbi:cilia- and flagella-associated protein 45 isoform X2 [Rhinatrema bivittatum]|uniref:cilia- and flagella-associated protein 45 isoform X2 n=1 Tax=Rhinatrema bivittatum TaxID=194408 RepID=UPI00112BA51F|nr:cilia- and flagella-associated protein 45 isoform X2 [Rhinatrema bivittatum]XP_029436144.1 cilia- and flagella-associated protein 45 isoform X2 [Rhinatrema bivittatum]